MADLKAIERLVVDFDEIVARLRSELVTRKDAAKAKFLTADRRHAGSLLWEEQVETDFQYARNIPDRLRSVMFEEGA